MEEKILLNYIEKEEYKLFYPLENIKILNTFVFSVILYYIVICYKSKIISELFILIFYYIIFFFISIFINLKTTNFLKNAIFLFITILLKENNDKINIHNICYYFITISVSYCLNVFFLKLFDNPGTIKDIFCQKEKKYFATISELIKKILYILFYFILDFISGFIHYYFSTKNMVYMGEYILSDYIICALFVFIFYLGGYYFEEIYKFKKPIFATILKRIIMSFLINITFGWYSFQLFLYLDKKLIMNKSYLFALFLLGIFLLGFFAESILNKIIFKYIRNYFYICLYSLIYFCYILPYFKEEYSLHIIYFLMMSFRLVRFLLFTYEQINSLQYISDCTILALLATLFYKKWEYVGVIIAIYIIFSLLECLIMRNDLSKKCKENILNLLSMLCLCIYLINLEPKIEKEAEIDEERKILRKHKNKKDKDSSGFTIYDTCSDLYISDFYFQYFNNIKKEPIKFDGFNCLLELKKNLTNYKKKNSELYSKIPKYNLAKTYEYNFIFDRIENIIKQNNIEQKLKKNYEESLIDDEKYMIKWNSNICEKYLEKFFLFALNEMKLNDLFGDSDRSKNYDKNSYFDVKPYVEPDNNLVTIFISGFLTEDKNIFLEIIKRVIIIFFYGLLVEELILILV